ncbi:putative amidoligase domain-containing protein [Paenibacillus lentus]|uniref:Phage phiEco32-like COOH.NH2 ligase-type 2 n=1 Tax=Paenibacillus lentus TaxID=1338368 RepID=A0A3Q8SC66_9BACL|nr:hypothetical protein [Paenibacillus lentus]AZK47351.1 hypothetical protein EIM92_15285 [Paenibacillus lentus]
MEQIGHVALRIQVNPGASADRLLEALKTLARGKRLRVESRKVGEYKTENALVSYSQLWLEVSYMAAAGRANAQEAEQRLEPASRRLSIMNENLQKFLSSSIHERQNRLTISGLNASLTESGNIPHHIRQRRFIRRYIVQVFHLRATSIAALGAGGINGPQLRQEEGSRSLLERRLEKIAVRTLYALNLQMGEVTIHAGEDGRFTVEHVSAMPDFGGIDQAELAAKAIISLLVELNHSTAQANGPKKLLGMDPEFLLFNRATGKVIPASRYLEIAGEAGCDSLRYRGERRFPLAELRPQPGGEPREVLVHLLRAFRIAYRAIDDKALQWQAGGMPQRGFPLGGHVHFSGIPLTFELLQVLDNYLALPVAVLEDRRGYKRRPRYGFLGDFRLQKHGGFEYRTLPSFLISPLVTKGVVAIAALIAGHWELLQRRPLQNERMYTAFYQGEQLQLRRGLAELYNDLSALAVYPKYESYIAPFMEATMSGRTWDETQDIRKVWKLENHS